MLLADLPEGVPAESQLIEQQSPLFRKEPVMTTPVRILLALTLGICASAVTAKDASQYNMSLQDKVVTGPKGSLTSPQAASS